VQARGMAIASVDVMVKRSQLIRLNASVDDACSNVIQKFAYLISSCHSCAIIQLQNCRTEYWISI